MVSTSTSSSIHMHNNFRPRLKPIKDMKISCGVYLRCPHTSVVPQGQNFRSSPEDTRYALGYIDDHGSQSVPCIPLRWMLDCQIGVAFVDSGVVKLGTVHRAFLDNCAMLHNPNHVVSMKTNASTSRGIQSQSFPSPAHLSSG